MALRHTVVIVLAYCACALACWGGSGGGGGSSGGGGGSSGGGGGSSGGGGGSSGGCGGGGCGGTSTNHGRIADNARRYIGSTEYSFGSDYGPGPNKYKCNYFVHDVLVESGASAPERRPSWVPGSYPISAESWGNRHETKSGWRVVGTDPSEAQRGDVAADGAHVGIVSGNDKTISASAREDKVVENDWGFRQQQLGDVIFYREE
ncbi:uncharacterized protein LOC102808938 [Saccoglossus kowalevskii]|uniref:Probable sucrose-phosphate synthase 1-like n=1 Tax=Saccoglossus kowalevskii TaxID=10224 RepID=A0ABM0MTZ4_SACKO|nr:PREDICTED: probable sucrose-phosphate synthase 1-like [Saccoglossus kowalevskii]